MNPVSRAKLDVDIAAAMSKLGAKLQELRGTPAVPLVQRDVRGAVRSVSAAPGKDEAGQALAAARRQAAVLGWFDPERLIDTDDHAVREQVLSALVGEVDIQPRGEHRLWSLRRGPRREVLADLADEPTLRARVLRDTKAQPIDPEARLLRRLLQGESLTPQRLRTTEPAQKLRVAEWTYGILDNAPDPSEVRGLMARDAILDSFGVLLRDGFRGRAQELKALRRFVSNPHPTHPDVPIFALSGIGGVGKSTLLARFADRLLALREDRRPAVVVIDFDRARFSSGDPLALTFELTRQVAAWFPALSVPLRDLRHSVRQNLLSSGSASASQTETVGLEGARRSMSELIHRLGGTLAKAGIGKAAGRPLVLILDTFEVLQGARGEGVESGFRGVRAVAGWAQDLWTISALKGLRIVAAGRAPIGEDTALRPLLAEPELGLSGLDPSSARALLQDLGLAGDTAEIVAQAVGDPADGSCNPLILRLAARLVSSGTLGVDALKAEVEPGRTGLDQELVQGILYRRILAHIGQGEGGDPALVALAHPGLVLRRVTPPLIEHVLAPVAGLRDVRSDRARELFEKLRREVWLVQDVGSDTVVHRSDLRRTMLRLIDADSRAQSVRIHQAAAEYYDAPLEPGLAPEIAAGEAFYHRLMLMDESEAARLDPAEVRRFESALHPTIDDLPRPVLAVVKSALGRPLNDAEGLALPEPRRTEFILRTGEPHLLNDEPYRALALLEGRPDLHPLWELRALSVTASWESARQRGLITPPSASRTQRMTAGELHERANLVTFVCFCLEDHKAAVSFAELFLSWFANESDWSKLPARLLEQIARGLTYRTVAVRASKRAPRGRAGGVLWSRLPHEYYQAASMALEATRHVALGLHQGDGEGRVVVNGEVVPPSLKLLDRLAKVHLPKELKRQLVGLRKDLAVLSKRSPSGLILGAIARRFPTPFVIETPRGKEHQFPWALLCPSPEFRGPAKFALMEAFDGPRQLVGLAELAWPLMDLRPGDLRPEVFATAAARAGRKGSEIANLVLYLDRCGVLMRFLRLAQAERPKAEKLARVADAFERWTLAFREQRAAQPR